MLTTDIKTTSMFQLPYMYGISFYFVKKTLIDKTWESDLCVVLHCCKLKLQAFFFIKQSAYSFGVFLVWGLIKVSFVSMKHYILLPLLHTIEVHG